MVGGGSQLGPAGPAQLNLLQWSVCHAARKWRGYSVGAASHMTCECLYCMLAQCVSHVTSCHISYCHITVLVLTASNDVSAMLITSSTLTAYLWLLHVNQAASWSGDPSPLLHSSSRPLLGYPCLTVLSCLLGLEQTPLVLYPFIAAGLSRG